MHHYIGSDRINLYKLGYFHTIVMATLLSCLEFKQEIELFLLISEEVGDSWKIKAVDLNDPSTYYLCRTKSINIPKNALYENLMCSGIINDEDDAGDFVCAELEDEDPCTVFIENKNNTLNLKFEHHILYSSSFCVPVLYFNCYREDGSSLSLDELWKTVPNIHKSQPTDTHWTTITQSQHPLLGFPFFHLHPCHTADLMKECQRPSGCSYIMSWLSSVGPMAHVDLPVDYLVVSEKLSCSSSLDE